MTRVTHLETGVFHITSRNVVLARDIEAVCLQTHGLITRQELHECVIILQHPADSISFLTLRDFVRCLEENRRVKALLVVNPTFEETVYLPIAAKLTKRITHYYPTMEEALAEARELLYAQSR